MDQLTPLQGALLTPLFSALMDRIPAFLSLSPFPLPPPARLLSCSHAFSLHVCHCVSDPSHRTEAHCTQYDLVLMLFPNKVTFIRYSNVPGLEYIWWAQFNPQQVATKYQVTGPALTAVCNPTPIAEATTGGGKGCTCALQLPEILMWAALGRAPSPGLRFQVCELSLLRPTSPDG